MCLINGAINILVFVMLNTPKSKVETHIDAEDQVYSGGHKGCCLALSYWDECYKVRSETSQCYAPEQTIYPWYGRPIDIE